MDHPERAAFLNGLFAGLDERTAIRMFHLFSKYREVTPGRRGQALVECAELLKERRKRSEEESERLRKLGPQLEKARREIRHHLMEMESSLYDPMVKVVELFRQLPAVEKHEAALDMIQFVEERLHRPPNGQSHVFPDRP